MAKKTIIPVSKRNSLRTHRQIFTLNDEENKALIRYINKYKISNKSKFIRETLMLAIIRKLEEDHPTLFDWFFVAFSTNYQKIAKKIVHEKNLNSFLVLLLDFKMAWKGGETLPERQDKQFKYSAFQLGIGLCPP